MPAITNSIYYFAIKDDISKMNYITVADSYDPYDYINEHFSNLGIAYPSRDGYTFKGWAFGCGCSYKYDDFSTVINEIPTEDVVLADSEQFYDVCTNALYGMFNIAIYAVWEVSTPTITFNSTTGTFESDSTTSKLVQIDLSGTTAISSIVETPVKPSYKLAGWSTTETGSVEYLPDATPTITADTTLYAVWELRDDIGIIAIYSELT